MHFRTKSSESSAYSVFTAHLHLDQPDFKGPVATEAIGYHNRATELWSVGQLFLALFHVQLEFIYYEFGILSEQRNPYLPPNWPSKPLPLQLG